MSFFFYDIIRFRPTQISSLQLWLDASDTSATNIVESGGLVSQWSDKSGQGNHATQGTGSAQPTTNSTTQNGKNTLVFDGTSDWMAANGVAAAGLGANTVVMACVPNSHASSGDIVAFQHSGGSSSNQAKFEISSAGQLQHSDSASTVYDTNDWQTVPFFQILTQDVSTVVPRINGAPATTSSFGDSLPASLDQFSLGQEFDGASASNFYGGVLAEVLVYDRELTSAEVALLENYLSRKWGI